MVESDYYQVLFEALRTRSLQRVAQAAYEMLHMPIVVTDVAYIVRAKYPDEPLDDEQWDANVMNRQIEPRFVKTFTDDDHFTRHDQAGKSILIDWGHYASAPRLTVVLRTRSGSVLGYCSALARDVEVPEWQYEAFDIVGEALSMLMEVDAGSKMAQGGLSSPVLYALLNGPIDEKITAHVLPSDFAKSNVEPYLLFCARPLNPHNVAQEAYFGGVVVKYFERAVQTVYDGCLYFLASSVGKDARGSARAELLADELERQGLLCGVSRRFEDLRTIRTRSWEARQALEIGFKLQVKEPLVHYEDFIADIAFDTLNEILPENALAHPLLVELKRHDEEANTEYLKTLEVYYRCEFDKKLTSEVLHIHRNTLQYRLNRIRELLELGDEEPYYLLMYFGMESYLARLREADGRYGSQRHTGAGR